MPKALLVGSFARQPAKLLLPHLRTGTVVQLVPEPDNPYDAEAMGVWLPVPEGQWDKGHEWMRLPFVELEDELLTVGWTSAQLIEASPIQLGYLARDGGKPLVKAAANGLDLIPASSTAPGEATLSWGPNGEAIVECEAK